MLELKVWDRSNEITLTFEHSLLSVSKWEAFYKKPFLRSPPKSSEEMVDYYRYMLTSPELDPDLVYRLAPAQLEQLEKYMNDSQTASVAPSDPDAPKTRSQVTSETIYYQMVALEIPFEAQTWHLNRLMMLIAITANGKQPPKKESKASFLSRWQEANKANRERFKSDG